MEHTFDTLNNPIVILGVSICEPTISLHIPLTSQDFQVLLWPFSTSRALCNITLPCTVGLTSAIPYSSKYINIINRLKDVAWVIILLSQNGKRTVQDRIPAYYSNHDPFIASITSAILIVITLTPITPAPDLRYGQKIGGLTRPSK